MPKQQKRGSGGEKTYGRWRRKPGNLRYLSERRHITNKARRLIRYMKRFPNYPIPSNTNFEVKLAVERFFSK